jgi:hypothetical protein
VLAVRRERLRLNKVACKLPFTLQSYPLNKSCRAILDARLTFEIKDGFIITSAFVTEDEVKTWAKILLPRLLELATKVIEMESIYITTFGFEDPEPR